MADDKPALPTIPIPVVTPPVALGEVDGRAPAPDPVHANADTIMAAIGDLRGSIGELRGTMGAAISELRGEVSTLKRRVDGSLPPSSLLASSLPAVGGVDLQKPVSVQLKDIREELGKQSVAMGLGRSVIDRLFSKEGVAWATGLAALYTAYHVGSSPPVAPAAAAVVPQIHVVMVAPDASRADGGTLSAEEHGP